MEDPFEKKLKDHGLFAAPLNNGHWMVGKANLIYHLNVSDDHYESDELSIAETIVKAVDNWLSRHGNSF